MIYCLLERLQGVNELSNLPGKMSHLTSTHTNMPYEHKMTYLPSSYLGLVFALLMWVMAGCTQTYSTEVDSSQKVAQNEGNLNTSLNDGDQFGQGLTNIGDLESDGVIDLAVGVPGDDTGGTDRGAVLVLFMDDNGEVDTSRKIAHEESGFSGELDDNDRFGSAVTALGDLNNDGTLDIAVGAPGDDEGGTDRGAVWILFLNSNGTVRQQQKIANETGGLSDVLNDSDQFGDAIANIGDLNGDGINDLAVGVARDNDGGSDRGAVWILFMNNDGTVNSQQKISYEQGSFVTDLDNDDRFGTAVTGLGDVDGDSVIDIAVSAPGDDDGGSDRGAVWILFMNTDGTVKIEQKISQLDGELDVTLANGEGFGSALANVDDYNRDGINELAVGASLNDDGGTDHGAFYVLFLQRNGNVISSSKISDTIGNFKETLEDQGQFGTDLISLGDLNGDGTSDIAVTASLDNNAGTDRGALWVLFMRPVEIGVRTDKDADLVTLFQGTGTSNSP